MQQLAMITTIDPGSRYPQLASGGRNTIRKFTGVQKYMALSIGDQVVMLYTDNPQIKAAAHVTEFLTVKSLAVAPLEALVHAHAMANHGSIPHNQLKEHILSFYPLPPAEEGQPKPQHDPNDLYIAIYF